MIIPFEETFQSYVRNFSTSCDSPECELSHLLRFWSKNKSYLQPHFPNLIVSKQVSFEYPVERSIQETFLSYKSKWSLALTEMRNLIPLSSPNSDEYYAFQRLFYASALSENRCPDTYNFTSLGIKVQKGEKLMRVYKKLSEIAQIPDFEFLRQDHSRILQNKKVKGELCLSIHPLDYITMSDNENNWSSCMNWMNEGEYRLGTVEMMNSPYVVVAYLRSPDKEISWTDYSNGEIYKWNSKIWRILLIVDPDRAIISVKDYPYNNEHLTKTAIQFLAETLQWPVSEPYELPKGAYNFDTCAMYNDCGSIPQYTLSIQDLPRNQYFYYSGETECMICGKELYTVEHCNAEYTSCVAEEQLFYCECCDEHIREDESTHTLYGTLICDNCRDDYYVFDDLAEGYIEKDDGFEIHYKGNIFIASCHTIVWQNCVNLFEPRFNEETQCFYLLEEDLNSHGLERFERML